MHIQTTAPYVLPTVQIDPIVRKFLFPDPSSTPGVAEMVYYLWRVYCGLVCAAVALAACWPAPLLLLPRPVTPLCTHWAGSWRPWWQFTEWRMWAWGPTAGYCRKLWRRLSPISSGSSSLWGKRALRWCLKTLDWSANPGESSDVTALWDACFPLIIGCIHWEDGFYAAETHS